MRDDVVTCGNELGCARYQHAPKEDKRVDVSECTGITFYDERSYAFFAKPVDEKNSPISCGHLLSGTVASKININLCSIITKINDGFILK